MDDENTIGWAASRRARDHRETVIALMEALPDWADGDEKLCDHMASLLGRAGYALVRTGAGDDFHARAAD